MSGLGPAILSLLVLSAFAMAGGGLHLLVTRRDRRRGILMLAVAAVMFGNVMILAL